jgi:hypothetical protein
MAEPQHWSVAVQLCGGFRHAPQTPFTQTEPLQQSPVAEQVWPELRQTAQDQLKQMFELQQSAFSEQFPLRPWQVSQVPATQMRLPQQS